MKSRVLSAALGTLVVALFASGQQAPSSKKQPAGKQQPAAPQEPAPTADPSTVIRVQVTRVPMSFAVSDKRGRFVTGLVKEDFEIFENGKPVAIQDFSAEPTLPLRVAVLIDTSNSVRDRFRFEQEAASQFVADMLRTTSDKALVISFDSEAQLVAPFTSSVEKLGDAIRGLRAGGGTSLFDAIRFASDKLAEEQPSTNFRRVMVVVGDGEDNQSRSTRDQALEQAQVADTLIYAISTNNSGGDSDGDKILRYFALNTGAKAFFPFKMEDLTEDFAKIAEDVRHQYTIVFRPESSADGQFRKVDIRVKGHKELVVRSRTGYYAGKADK